MLWKFQRPLTAPLRVLLAGPDFPAFFPVLQGVLKERNLSDKIHLIHCPENYHGVPAEVAMPFMQPFDAKYLESNPDLRFVQQVGVGLEGVDLQRATELQVAVSNVPAQGTGNAQATSELGVFLAMHLLRHVPDWKRRVDAAEIGGLPLPRALCGKRVTVVGYGSIGKVLVSYLLALGADVTVVRRSWPSDDTDDRIRKSTSLEEALPESHDILFLACVLTPETKHMLNEQTMRLLKPSSLIVNIGRGALVEYEALQSALEDDRIGGFASDVGIGYTDGRPAEPVDPNDPLRRHANVLFTPHVAGYTDYAYDNMGHVIVDALERVQQGLTPGNWANRPLDWKDEN